MDGLNFSLFYDKLAIVWRDKRDSFLSLFPSFPFVCSNQGNVGVPSSRHWKSNFEIFSRSTEFFENCILLPIEVQIENIFPFFQSSHSQSRQFTLRKVSLFLIIPHSFDHNRTSVTFLPPFFPALNPKVPFLPLAFLSLSRCLWSLFPRFLHFFTMSPRWISTISGENPKLIRTERYSPEKKKRQTEFGRCLFPHFLHLFLSNLLSACFQVCFVFAGKPT